MFVLGAALQNLLMLKIEQKTLGLNKLKMNRELQLLIEDLENLEKGLYLPEHHNRREPLQQLNWNLMYSKMNFYPKPGQKVYIYWDAAQLYPELDEDEIYDLFPRDEGILIAIPGYQHVYFEEQVVVWVPRPSWGYEKCDPEPQWVCLDVILNYPTIAYVSDVPLQIPGQEYIEKEDRYSNGKARKFMKDLQHKTYLRSMIHDTDTEANKHG